ncbi:hypothetical protein LguiA_035871 [Lonicera macranthoides]
MAEDQHVPPFPSSESVVSFPGSRLHNVHSSIFSWSILHSPSSIRPSEHWDSNEQNAPLLRIHNSYRISSAEPFVISSAASSAGLALQTDGVSTFSLKPSWRSPPLRREVRIRSVRILIGLGLTWFTRYWFPEELISPLAKPFLTLPLDSYFVRTQSTEASPTYVATSPIACSYFVFPLISHQIWCFLIPSCYGEQRTKYNRFLHLSGSRFSLFLFLTPPRVVPNVWHFPYFMGATSTNSLMIKLQPKIYDHIMLTVRISFIPSVCSQVPVIVIRLPEPRGLSVETSTNNRRFLMVFPLLTAALSTPPDIWCQIVARFLISSIIELAISVASIVQVREEGWTSGMRESGSIDKKEE